MIKGYLAAIIALLLIGWVPFLLGEELPVPRYANSLIISIHQSPLDGAEVEYIQSRFKFGLYAWLSFSTNTTPNLPWHHDWTDAAAGIQGFKDTMNTFFSRSREKNVRLHLILCSGIARGLGVYREAKKEDIRNCSWYNDNKLASDTQIADPQALDKYVFGTFSRYARKMRANLEAKTRAVAAFLKQHLDKDPDTLIAVSGWGEAEMNFNRIDPVKNLQEYFCDYSPFAVLEFRDWICHAGLYDDLTGAHRGQGYPQGGAMYQSDTGLARFNAAFGTNFRTWDLKYFHWSLADDYDLNPVDDVNNDAHRIPLARYAHGGMMPVAGSDLIEGGFDPPRSMMTAGRFLDLWNLFRQTMVHNFVIDMAKWMSEAGLPSDQIFSHQIPADYLNGSEPSWPEKYGRYYASASPLWTADTRPFGSIGATIYDTKFPPGMAPEEFMRTSKYSVPVIGEETPNWAILEYDAETYPPGLGVTQSTPDVILEQFLRLYRYRAHLINFYQWYDKTGEHRIKGMNKEIALADFIEKIRDKARATSLNTVYDPPKTALVSGLYDPGRRAVKLEWEPTIWSGHPWEWKDWGDFSHFEIHRSPVSGFAPEAANLLATTADYFFEDKSARPGFTYFYRFRAVNRNQAGGPYADEVSVPVASPGKRVKSDAHGAAEFGR
jgi:hypothetical protein